MALPPRRRTGEEIRESADLCQSLELMIPYNSLWGLNSRSPHHSQSASLLNAVRLHTSLADAPLGQSTWLRVAAKLSEIMSLSFVYTP
jgi:hypothetical protein